LKLTRAIDTKTVQKAYKIIVSNQNNCIANDTKDKCKTIDKFKKFCKLSIAVDLSAIFGTVGKNEYKKTKAK